MPIFEYLCPPCNRVFSFLVKSAAAAEPVCPKCGGKDLRRRVSRFAVTGAVRKSQPGRASLPAGDGGAGPDTAQGGSDPLDDPRIEGEMMKLMSEAEGLDESNPRQLGRLMRRMTEITGEAPEPAMEEAMRRLEAGDDPDAIEADLGDELGDGAGPGAGAPSYDDGLYEA